MYTKYQETARMLTALLDSVHCHPVMGI